MYCQYDILLGGVSLLLTNYPKCLNSVFLLLIVEIFAEHVN